MAKSRYADRFLAGRALLENIHDEHIGRLERMADARDREATLRDWAQLAGAESAVRERYLGRYLFELIQNANDAIYDARTMTAGNHHHRHGVRIELTHEALCVANDGLPFGEEGVRALCQLYRSTKPASKCIGHKGIGFKSVLEITEMPEVYSDIYAFSFQGHLFRRKVGDLVGRELLDGLELPSIKVPFMHYLNQQAPEIREGIETLLDDGYVTVVRLPFPAEKAAQCLTQVEQDIAAQIRPDLLLFLPDVARIEVVLPEGTHTVLKRQELPTPHPNMKQVLVQQQNGDGSSANHRWLVLGPVQRDIPDPAMIEALNSKAWQDVEALRFTIAIPLDAETEELHLASESQPFYVYFPTKEQSGLRFLIHADFYVGDDRKTLPVNELNAWLTDEICAYLAEDGVELLKKFWPSGPELVRILAPVSEPQQDFPMAFRRLYRQWLSLSSFVPAAGRRYVAPSDTRMPPKEVEQRRFRRLFAPSLLRDAERWDYPTEAVVTEEHARASPFLLALGSEVIDLAAIVNALAETSMPDIDRAGEYLSLLADWWDSLPRHPQDKRAAFVEQLQVLPVFPTTATWEHSGDRVVFHANLRAGAQDFAAPPGFEFSIIRRSVYPDAGTRSAVHRLLSELGATEYSARNVIRDCILPVLTDAERFAKLEREHPQSIWEAYAFLQRYHQDDGSTRDIESRLKQVPVPAARAGDQYTRGWRQAQACYLGRSWRGGEALEEVFGPFDDADFLLDIPQLHIVNEAEQEEWREFFEWLGVHAFPRISEAKGRIERGDGPPFPGAALWSEYMSSIDDGFRCRHPTKGHGYSRQLSGAHALEHFDDLVEAGSAEQLTSLYQLLATGWQQTFRPYTRATMDCLYVSTGCPSDRVEDYFLYALRHAAWLPAEMSGKTMACLSPKHIWTLGETDPAAARQLVPTLPAALRTGMYQDLANDLAFTSSSVAEIEDYVELLRLFPARYDIGTFSEGSEGVEQWQRSLGAVFNWICERLQVGLGSRGDAAPPRPDDLCVLATRDGELCYEPVTTPALVYPDNALQKQRWSPHCAYLLGNDDWQRLRGWMGVPDLSKVIDTHQELGAVLPEETTELRRLFDHTLPYYLALIRTDQPSTYESILARMRRLHVHVVDRLSVKEAITSHTGVMLETEVPVYLDKTNEPNPRGGRALRAGHLYVTPAVLTNPDLLGGYIADYVEIARLGDAFVLLIDRVDDDGRWRFLDSKGVAEATLHAVRADLARSLDDSESQALDQELIDTFVAEKKPHGSAGQPRHQVGDTEQPRLTGGDEADGDDGDGEVQSRFPPLDPEAIPTWTFAPSDLPTADAPRRGSGGGGGGPIRDGESDKEIGRRGEEWVYRMERHRLRREYGEDPDALERSGELVWVASARPTADHDIRSIWLTPTGERRALFIEVKATTGQDRRILLSRAEFELALTQGSDYWLCFVGNTGDAVPDDPVCYRDLARYIRDKQVALALNKVTVTLPEFDQD